MHAIIFTTLTIRVNIQSITTTTTHFQFIIIIITVIIIIINSTTIIIIIIIITIIILIIYFPKITNRVVPTAFVKWLTMLLTTVIFVD